MNLDRSSELLEPTRQGDPHLLFKVSSGNGVDNDAMIARHYHAYLACVGFFNRRSRRTALCRDDHCIWYRLWGDEKKGLTHLHANQQYSPTPKSHYPVWS